MHTLDFIKEKKITIMASGMGMPSMGIYSYELLNFIMFKILLELVHVEDTYQN